MVKTRENGERTEGEVTRRPEAPPEGKRAVSIRRGKLLFFPDRPDRPDRSAGPARRFEKEGEVPASDTEVSGSSGSDET